MAKRWTCLEAGCGHEVVGGDLEEVVQQAQAHMRDAHGSVELEDVVEAAVEDVPGG